MPEKQLSFYGHSLSLEPLEEKGDLVIRLQNSRFFRIVRPVLQDFLRCSGGVMTLVFLYGKGGSEYELPAPAAE